MAWERIQNWQESEVGRFFAEQEIQCVAASFRFQHFNPARDALWGWRDTEGRLRAILFFSGSVLHPLMDIHDPQGKDRGPFDNREALCSIVKKILHSPCRRLRSIQGNDFLISLFDELVTEIGLFPRDTQEYLLMRFPLSAVRFSSNTQAPLEAPNKETLHFFGEGQQPNNHFYKELYKLQAAYEQEEVLPKGSPFDAASCRLTLDSILKHHLLVAVEKDGILVAKANTNAWGFNHVQIGGVYVSPLYRNQGIAGRMLARLIEELQGHQKPITLFVKKGNIPARRLYEKLGFTYVDPPWGEYRISYY
ncbi:MAG TPA: GNAT family N-acetyltransferase [Termitinemataceae bacterium]|nr:GNAT family N-acetyltransferase [Termitinemataceae bacterium]HOM23281.1 GNAT family N-acetyltransferase [Termitinemataceae bacterium]HPQ00485.1 GNAT family N-acetyltransferase [Termitinemataceae bacterium]